MKKMAISVYDTVSGVTFIFKNHSDKHKFFDTWDETVVRVIKHKKNLKKAI